MSQTLANHSYVNLSLVGLSGSDSVQCYTDLYSCCSSTDGPHRGDWYFPNGTRPPFTGSGDIYEYRGDQRVYLGRRNNPTSPIGIYCCNTATNDVHDDYYISVRDAVYVGLCIGGGGNANWKNFTKHDWLTSITIIFHVF